VIFFVWKGLQYRSLESLDPVTKDKVLIAPNEEMQMVRHNNISAECDIEL